MSQIHKRFTDEQVRMLFQSYSQGQLSQGDGKRYQLQAGSDNEDIT